MLSIESVNVGGDRPLKIGERDTRSGIYKQPVDHPVEVKPLGITGDCVIDTRHHGGLDQALYLYRVEDYEWWQAQRPLPTIAGLFGENLTLRGIPEPGLDIGSRMQFDQVLLEVTAPRIPCGTLAARMDDKQFVKTFLDAGRPGFYCRVLKPGTLQTGETGLLIEPDYKSLSTCQLYEDVRRKLSIETLNQYLALPIDERTRADFVARLSKLQAG